MWWSKNKSFLADIALFLAAVIWGGGFVAGKWALISLTPFYISTFRFLGSAILLAAIFHRHLKQMPKSIKKAGMLIGTLLFLGQFIQVTALQYTTASKQAFIIASYTVFVPFLSWIILKKKPTYYAIIAGIMTMAGIGILSLNGNFSISIGDGLSLLYAMMFGLQIVLLGLFMKEMNVIQFTIIQFLTAGILSMGCAICFEKIPQVLSKETIAGVFYLIVFNTTIAFTIQNIAQKYTSDTHTSILLSMEALFGVIFSVLLLKEEFTIKMIFGAILIFIAVILSKMEKIKKIDNNYIM